MNRIIPKCSCHINKKLCVLHGLNKGNVRQILNQPQMYTPNTIKQGGDTVEKNLKDDTWKHLTWTPAELKKMSKEELWTVACLLKIPHINTEITEAYSTKLSLLRHIKARLGMYTAESLEKYYKTYPSMKGRLILPCKD